MLKFSLSKLTISFHFQTMSMTIFFHPPLSALAMYEGVSRSFWTESIMKYLISFVIACCFCHLQISPLQSLCNESSISATTVRAAGTYILESHVGQSAVFPECQRCPANDTLSAVILFLEHKITRSQIKQVMGDFSPFF
jgi:hypothetical protein